MAQGRTDSKDGVFDIGAWVGRHQALACIGSACSAADAQALKTIRDEKLYRPLNLNWHEFCQRHARIDHKTADRIIERLNEFGESYFELSNIVKIPANQYRALQAAIENNTVEFDGQRIAIDRKNTEQLIATVTTLREQLKQSQPDKQPAAEALQKRANLFFRDLRVAIERMQDDQQRGYAALMVEDLIGRLRELRRGMGVE